MQLLRKLLGNLTGRDPGGVEAVTPAAPSVPGGDPDDLLARSEKLLQTGRFAGALRLVDDALAADAHHPALRLARISTLAAWGRIHEARLELSRLPAGLRLRPEQDARLAAAQLRLGDLVQAETAMRRALSAEPESSAHRAGLAAILQRQERVAEAVSVYASILDRDPADFDAAMGLGSCELDRRDPEAAEACFRRALDIDPERAVAWMYLGVALDRQNRGEEGLAANERAVELERAHGEDIDAYLGLAGSLRDAGRFAEAMALLEPNLQRSQAAEAQMLRAHMLLALGRLPEGWQQNESRWLTSDFAIRRARYDKPAWAGQELSGRTILLRAEQGIGDTIQFARYASLVKALGATVVLAVPPDLLRLARGFHGVDQVVDLSAGAATPPFDYYISLLSLPRVFGTALAGIPASVHYLDVEADRIGYWTERMAANKGSFKVGLVWGGNPMNLEDRYRSLPLAMLAALGEVPGVQFYALQKGARERDATVPPPGMALINLGPELKDFSDTAAVIGQLDLVISVCTSVAHLTGALGKPLWVMLHLAADWRWLTGRSDSPWYPTARLFRQTRRGEWSDVVGRVRNALAERVEEGAGRSALSCAPPAQVSLPDAKRPSEMPGFRVGDSMVAQAKDGIFEVFPDNDEGASIVWYGEWMQSQLDLLGRLARPGATMIDVGSGFGAQVAGLAKIVGDSGQVFAYEWRAPWSRVLRRNLAANRLPAVTPMRRRLGSPEASGAAGETESSQTGRGEESVDDLRLTRLDWLRINGGVPAADVLAGATETLWRLRPALLLIADDEAEFCRLVEVVGTYGYRSWRHESPLFNPLNFNRRANDIFDGRKSLAVLAYPEETEAELPRSLGLVGA